MCSDCIKMRVYPECGPCMLNRALLFCRNENELVKYRVVREVCKLFSEKFSDGISTTEIAYERNKIIERITRNMDPMREIKEKSLKAALEVYPELEDYVKGIKDEKERFKTALRIALAGNILEFGARDHSVNLNDLKNEIFSVVNGGLAIDDSDEIYERAKKLGEILYVTDNTGELVFDRIFTDELKKYARVSIAPLSRPVQDDASVGDLKIAGINNCEIIPRSDCIGVWFERCTPEFLKKWDKADLIIAKGMGCYETLVDHPEKTKGKVALLMKVKCMPVSRHINAPLGSAIVKLM